MQATCEGETPSKKQKSLVGPIDPDSFVTTDSGPPLLGLRRQDTIPDMVCCFCVI